MDKLFSHLKSESENKEAVEVGPSITDRSVLNGPPVQTTPGKRRCKGTHSTGVIQSPKIIKPTSSGLNVSRMVSGLPALATSPHPYVTETGPNEEALRSIKAYSFGTNAQPAWQTIAPTNIISRT